LDEKGSTIFEKMQNQKMTFVLFPAKPMANKAWHISVVFEDITIMLQRKVP